MLLLENVMLSFFCSDRPGVGHAQPSGQYKHVFDPESDLEAGSGAEVQTWC